MPPRHDHTMDALQYALGVPPLPSKDWDALNTFRGVPVNRRWPRLFRAMVANGAKPGPACFSMAVYLQLRARGNAERTGGS